MNKKFTVAFLGALFLITASRAAEDCSKSDACSQPEKKTSPFLAEVKRAEKTAELKQGKPREPELRQGKPPDPELRQGKPQNPELKPAPVRASSAAAAAAESPAEKEVLSKPAWLLVMFALLAGLYYFLKEGKKRGKKT